MIKKNEILLFLYFYLIIIFNANFFIGIFFIFNLTAITIYTFSNLILLICKKIFNKPEISKPNFYLFPVFLILWLFSSLFLILLLTFLYFKNFDYNIVNILILNFILSITTIRILFSVKIIANEYYDRKNSHNKNPDFEGQLLIFIIPKLKGKEDDSDSIKWNLIEYIQHESIILK